MLLLIGDKVEQWKRNKLTDLNNEAKDDIQWHDWKGFKKSFKDNWGEFDSPRTAITELYKLIRQRNKISTAKYLQLFKELIRKANITQDAGAIPFCRESGCAVLAK